MYISKAFKEERLMLALTGATLDEFQRTANALKWAMWSFYTTRGLNIPMTTDRKCSLSHTNLKLFFILFYLRFNPTLRLIGFLFGMSRTQAHYWVKKLCPHLSHVLCHNVRPCCPKAKSIEQLTDIVPEIEELLNVTPKVCFNVRCKHNAVKR